jgi:glutamate dehydrogenase
MAERRGMRDLAVQRRFMHDLETRNLLDRRVEFLPDEKALTEREAKAQPLTRAELGVLLAYAKIVLFRDLVASDLPDDPILERDLFGYFPHRMAEAYRAEIAGHRLRREIIATGLANDVINRGGPSFVSRLQDLTGRTAAAVGRAFVIVREGFELNRLYARIDALDNRIDGGVQLDLYAAIWRLLQGSCSWFLKNSDEADLRTSIAGLKEARAALGPELPRVMPEFMRESLEERTHALRRAEVPDDLAADLALLPVIALVPDIALVARAAGAGLVQSARSFFAVTDIFRISRIEEAAQSIQPTDYYDGLALSRAADTIDAARRGICILALSGHRDSNDPVGAFVAAGGERIARARERLHALTEGGEITVSRLSVASGLMADLAGGAAAARAA